MKSKLRAVRNPVKFLKLFSIWMVVFMVFFAKKTDVADHKTSIKPKKDKVAILSAEEQEKNSFLFVDCTGFFE